MKVLGISRSPKFSPNSVDRDAAIFASVVSKMCRKGHDVSTISEDLFIAVDLDEFDLVFSMARGHDVLECLAEAETKHQLKVVNSAHDLLAATRFRLVKLFQDAGIPQPRTQVLDLAEYQLHQLNCEIPFPLWIKRGDACAQQVGDVSFLNSAPEMEQAIQKLTTQGVDKVIAVEHVKGDLVKFYGVEGTSFFFYTYPTDGNGFSKFGLEKHNGAPSHLAFDADELKQVADLAARTTGFTIYGGDAIIKEDGTFQFIDFNDWPSFSACRKEAAKAIAQRLNMNL